MLKEIKIIATERTVRETGKKFISFSAVKADGKLIDCRFRQEITNIPKTEGKFIVKADSENMNISRAKEYPVLWFKAVDSFTPIGEVKADANDEEINNMF